MSLRQKILVTSDRVLCVLIAAVLLISTLGFGGAVWWIRPILFGATFTLVLTKLMQNLIAGRMPLLRSPLTLLGLLALGLAIVQLAPLPARFARRLSPVAQDIYTHGFIPRLVQTDDPGAKFPETPRIRTPATLDRSATIRWLVGASACLGLFWGVSHFVDRLSRLFLVWGVIVAAFLLNGSLAIVQISCRAEGLYGLYLPGAGPGWAPTLVDLLDTPTTAVLRNVPEVALNSSQSAPRVVLTPNTSFQFGTLMGGSGAFLALGALALPLTLSLVLHLIAPRGSRESLLSRLGHSSQGSLVVLLAVLMTVCAFLTGMLAGHLYAIPFALGLLTVGLPSATVPGSRWSALGLTALMLVSLGLGVALAASWSVLVGGQPPVHVPDLDAARDLWNESLRIFREFPLVGVGLGGFPTIHPYFKEGDLTSTTAMSSLLLWGVESGWIGLGLLSLAASWSLIRLPGSLKRVGRVDRSLAYGLIGAALSLSLLAVVHWTVELSAVAFSVSALGGTWNRWLAGGTDLFVERG